MNRIATRFDALKKKNEKGLVGFVVAGDPTPQDSLELLTAMCGAGLDILELGVPFSDPTADGPVIQRAAARALHGGASLAGAIEMTAALRERVETPILLFSYYNPIFVYGPGEFLRDAAKAGADGVLVVDLPPEESTELTEHLRGRNGFALIRLVAPTTPAERMKQIAASGSGFLYLISKAGVTGSSGLDAAIVRERVASLRSVTELPICVGFGIADPADAAALVPSVEGVVIGSAFERTIEENLGAPDIAKRLADQVRVYRAAINAPPPMK